MLIYFYLFIRAIIFDETCVLEITVYAQIFHCIINKNHNAHMPINAVIKMHGSEICAVLTRHSIFTLQMITLLNSVLFETPS